MRYACTGTIQNVRGGNADSYDAIQKHDLFWLCDRCQRHVPSFRALTQGKMALEMGSEKITRIEKKIDDISKALLENTTSMKEDIAKVEAATKSYSEVVKTGHSRSLNESSSVVASNDLQEFLNTFQHEKDEQSKRKCNLAVVNMPESTATESVERVKDDSDLFSEIVKEELKLNVKVEKAIRVGKRNENKPRILIATLKDEDTKWEILKASKALRNSENDVAKNIYINKDMTQKEREKNRALREEVKKRRSQGENVKIVKGRCVILEESKKQVEQKIKTTTKEDVPKPGGAPQV